MKQNKLSKFYKKLELKNNDILLIKTAFYPTSYKPKGGRKVLLGIGGNIGNVTYRFQKLFIYLNRSSLLSIIETAPIIKNPPFGYLDQDYFYNSLILIETELNPKELLSYLLNIENKFGRKRLFQDAPRTLDIDIIFYENIDIKTKKLTIPHMSWKSRDSILIPLSYMIRPFKYFKSLVNIYF